MNFSIKFDTVKCGWSIVYVEGVKGYNLKKIYILYFYKDRFCLSKQCKT